MSKNPRFAKPLWHLIDAKDQVVGRLATQIVHILKGKHKPFYNPSADCGDYVVVVNAANVKFTGRKKTDKLYRWHTGYVGGLKEMNVAKQLEIKPEEVLRKAVMGMLAKNTLRKFLGQKLRIFPYELHLHTDKLPEGTQPINNIQLQKDIDKLEAEQE